MDTETLVENRLNDGQKFVEELARRGFEVSAAFWLKATDDDKWRFYIVSPLVDTEGFLQAYMRLHPVVWALPQPFGIRPLEINLIGPSDPLGQDVLAIYNRAASPWVAPLPWRGIRLGRKSIEGAYLYPLPATTP